MRGMIGILGLVLILFGCAEKNNPSVVNAGYYAKAYEFSYNLNEGSHHYLSSELVEVSGLTSTGEENSLYAINDERGVLYQLNNEGQILSKWNFGPPDDYEGLSYNNGYVYICTSNGKVYIIDEATQELKTVNRTDFKKKNDIEGLCFDPSSNSFLFAAKGRNVISKKGYNNKKRSIFSLHVDSLMYHPRIFASIQLRKAIKDFELSANFTDSDLVRKRLKSFAPSGIAIHPITSEIFILSARGELLIIMDSNKAIKAILLLDQKINRQPEGICFDTLGNMYISNEGDGRQGQLSKYTYNQ